MDRLVTACNTPVAEGMVILTDSPRARKFCRANVQLILSQHDCLAPPVHAAKLQPAGAG